MSFELIRLSKMQFKVIASILLFFLAQTMAVPNPQLAEDICMLPFMVLR